MTLENAKGFARKLKAISFISSLVMVAQNREETRKTISLWNVRSIYGNRGPVVPAKVISTKDNGLMRFTAVPLAQTPETHRFQRFQSEPVKPVLHWVYSCLPISSSSSPVANKTSSCLELFVL